MTRTFEVVAVYHGGHHIIGYEENMDHIPAQQPGELEVVAYIQSGHYFARDRGKPYNNRAAEIILVQSMYIQELTEEVRNLKQQLGKIEFQEAPPDVPHREDPPDTNWRERVQNLGRVLPPD